MAYTAIVDVLCALLRVMCHMVCLCCALWRHLLTIAAVASDDALSWQFWTAFLSPVVAGSVTVIKITVTGWGVLGPPIAVKTCVV